MDNGLRGNLNPNCVCVSLSIIFILLKIEPITLLFFYFKISFNDRRENSFNTCSKRPFAPRNAHDISVGDIIKFSRQGGKISKGQVKYVGPLPNKNDTYYGVELEHESKPCGVILYFSDKLNRK